MIKELDRIVYEVNNSSWSKLEKMRYAYIELGKIAHKDIMFFYTVQNNLLGRNNRDLEYSVDKIDEIINSDNRYDYSVICKNSAEMLKYIYDRCGIDCEIRKTLEANSYTRDGKTVDINHYFLVARDEANNNYFITLNPDLPNIQIGKRTSHFGNYIDYMMSKKVIDENGEKSVISVQYYEGDKIDARVLSQSEIEELDKKIGYKNTILDDNQTVYTDEFFNLLRKSYASNDEYLSYLKSQTEFYVDLSKLMSKEKTLAEVLDNHTPPTKEEFDNSYLNLNIMNKTKEECNDIKLFILLNTIQTLYDRFHMKITDEELKEYNDLLLNHQYDEIANKYKNDFLKDPKRREIMENLGMHNPLKISRKLSLFYKVFDKLYKNENMDSTDFKKTKIQFSDLLGEISLLYVPPEYLPFRDYASSTYITHKLIYSFNQIFDTNYRSEFNDLELAEQISIVKEIMEIVLSDLKVDGSIPNYDDSKSPVKNRILSTVIFDKDSHKPYYLMCVKNTKSDISQNNGYTPIIFDMIENKILTDKTVIELYEDNYIVKDDELRLMIENPTNVVEESISIQNSI